MRAYIFILTITGFPGLSLAQADLNNHSIVRSSSTIYRQNVVEQNEKTYYSDKEVIAGDHVDNTTARGNCIVSKESDTKYYSSTAVVIKLGCTIEKGAHFIAKVTRPGEFNTLFDNVNIFPNPVKDKLNISFVLSKDANVDFIISNVLGQTLQRSEPFILGAGNQMHTLNTNELLPGIYFLTIKTTEASDKFRFIKQ